MNKKQIKQLQSLGLPGDYPFIKPTIVVLTCDVKPDQGGYRFGMPGRSGMVINMQDAMLVTQIRYRILGKKFRGMNDLKNGTLQLSVNNWIIFTIPLQWVARSLRGIIVDPNIILIGSKNINLNAQLDARPGDNIPADCQLAVALHGYCIENSTVIN